VHSPLQEQAGWANSFTSSLSRAGSSRGETQLASAAPALPAAVGPRATEGGLPTGQAVLAGAQRAPVRIEAK